MKQEAMFDRSQGYKCVSLHQWWASLVSIDVKRIDTRDWATTYRGPLAIQAAQKIPAYAKEMYLQKPSVREVLFRHFNIRRKDELCMLPTGAILCVTELVDVIRITSDNPRNLPIPDKFKTDGWEEFGNYSRGRYLWLFDGIQALREPIPCRGYQSLWNLPAGITSQLQAQLSPTKLGLLPQLEVSFNEPVEPASPYEQAIHGLTEQERRNLLHGQWQEETTEPPSDAQVHFIKRALSEGTMITSTPVGEKSDEQTGQ